MLWNYLCQDYNIGGFALNICFYAYKIHAILHVCIIYVIYTHYIYVIYIYISITYIGWGSDLVGKEFAAQTNGLEFESQEPSMIA